MQDISGNTKREKGISRGKNFPLIILIFTESSINCPKEGGFQWLLLELRK